MKRGPPDDAGADANKRGRTPGDLRVQLDASRQRLASPNLRHGAGTPSLHARPIAASSALQSTTEALSARVAIAAIGVLFEHWNGDESMDGTQFASALYNRLPESKDHIKKAGGFFKWLQSCTFLSFKALKNPKQTGAQTVSLNLSSSRDEDHRTAAVLCRLAIQVLLESGSANGTSNDVSFARLFYDKCDLEATSKRAWETAILKAGGLKAWVSSRTFLASSDSTIHLKLQHAPPAAAACASMASSPATVIAHVIKRTLRIRSANLLSVVEKDKGAIKAGSHHRMPRNAGWP